MKKCPACKNFRFVIFDDKPQLCKTCNKNGKYKLKEIEVCLGCGKENPCPSDCPAGTGKTLIVQK